MCIRDSASTPPSALLIRRDLINLGFEPSKIELRFFYIGPPPEWDLFIGGWCADYPDPYNFFSTFDQQNELGYPSPSLDDPRYAAKIEAAERLRGAARFKRFGDLDLEIMRNVAPLAVMRTYNNRYFFSNRVDPKSLAYNYVYGDWSIPALALK